jgi:hypothetical protein
MIPRKRTPLSAMQRAEVWRRWKAGESLHGIGRAVGKDHVVVHLLLRRHGGIAPTSHVLVVDGAAVGVAGGAAFLVFSTAQPSGCRTLCCLCKGCGFAARLLEQNLNFRCLMGFSRVSGGSFKATVYSPRTAHPSVSWCAR